MVPELVEESRLPPVSTWDLLQAIGFVTETEARMGPGLRFSFGNFEARANECITSRFVPAVSLHGVFQTERTFSIMEDQLPREVASRELGLALLAFCIDKATDGKVAVVPAWLEEGRGHRNLLPWEQSAAAYRARPRCYVPRDWARMALKDLAVHLSVLADDEHVTFTFDGRVMSISCAGKLIPLQAEGVAWKAAFSLQAGTLRDLPKRLMRDPVEFSTDDQSITFGGRRYSGIPIACEEEADRALPTAGGDAPELGDRRGIDTVAGG